MKAQNILQVDSSLSSLPNPACQTPVVLRIPLLTALLSSLLPSAELNLPPVFSQLPAALVLGCLLEALSVPRQMHDVALDVQAPEWLSSVQIHLCHIIY